MADYLHSLAIQGNLFHNSMPDKTAWRINEYSLYNNIVFVDMLNLTHNECLLSNWKSEEVTSNVNIMILLEQWATNQNIR